MLGAGEVVLIPTILREVMRAGGRDAAISAKVAAGSIMCLVPPLAWRIYVLFVRPEMMGSYTEMKRS